MTRDEALKALSDRVEREIVKNCIASLMSELARAGIRVIGFAGGVILAQQDAAGKNPCHTFFLIDPDCTMKDRSPIVAQEFIDDVAKAMIRSRDSSDVDAIGRSKKTTRRANPSRNVRHLNRVR